MQVSGWRQAQVGEGAFVEERSAISQNLPSANLWLVPRNGKRPPGPSVVVICALGPLPCWLRPCFFPPDRCH